MTPESRPLPTTDEEAIARLRAATIRFGPDAAEREYRSRRSQFCSRVDHCFTNTLYNRTGFLPDNEPEPSPPATEGQVAILALALHRMLAVQPLLRSATHELRDVHRCTYVAEQARKALRLCGWTPPGEEAPPHEDPVCMDVECLGGQPKGA